MSLTDRQKVGALGEGIAAKYLASKGYFVVERNYRKKFGEIDIVTKKGEILHFVEVKSVSRETVYWEDKEYRPEENVHPQKMRRLANTIEAYLMEKGQGREWQFHVVTVYIDQKRRKARCELVENVIL